MLSLFSNRTHYAKNGTQWMGKALARIIGKFQTTNDSPGENNYEFVRLEKRIMYARFWYSK